MSGQHPRVAVFLGVNAHWHVPLLVCRALSTAPAVWWGLRCALTFLGELLWSNHATTHTAWNTEKRFRVTEVFLAILWVGGYYKCALLGPSMDDSASEHTSKRYSKSLRFADSVTPTSVLHRRTSLSSSWIVSCQDGMQQHQECLSCCYADGTFLSRLLFYTPPATLVRLLATNATIVWLTSYVLYLSGASDDPRMLLPAWVSIATVRSRSVLLAIVTWA